jgi:twinkle protein
VGFKEACETISGGNYEEYTQESKAKLVERAPKTPPLTKQQVKDHIDTIGYSSDDYRGISDKYSKFFGHLTEVDSNGVVKARHYPETSEGAVTGYKIRRHPKSFDKVGSTGIRSDLSGQIKFNSGGKWLLIVGGEEDKAAAYEMLAEAQKERGQGEFASVAVVSPTTGESSAARQIAANYDFCDTFDNIVIGMDNDEAGKEATKKIVEVLPKDKVSVSTWTGKDPNKMLQLSMSKQFVRDFYSAKPAVSSSIRGSSELDDMLEKELLVEKIPLPPFMSKLQGMMAGGIPLGYIVNISAETGIGKTSIVNEMLYYWIFNSPHKMGVVSLELTAGQYGLAMLSRHIGRKLTLFEDGKEAVEFINTPEVKKQRKTLWQNEYGESRWVLLDDRDGSLEELKRQCEILIKKHECKFIVLDPLQDILDGCTIEEQSIFMRWQKQMVKAGITFININHVRKIGSVQKDKEGKNIVRDLAEDDIHGSSAIAKSAGANIFAMRDKNNEDDIIKNTTRVIASKIRWTGRSGSCGKWFYDLVTHTLYDFDTYFGKDGN